MIWWLWILVSVVGIGIIGLIVFLVVYFKLAPKNRWFTFVKEGTAKIIVRGDKFEKALIQWENCILNQDGNVEQGKEPWHPFGGLRYYGFYPIKDVYIYKFQWTGVNIDGQVQVHPEEVLDYVLLKEDVYWCKVQMAEDGNLLPLDIELLLTMKVVNPYKAIFRIQNWVETVVNRTKPLFREYVASTTFDKLVSQKQEAGGEIFKKVKDTGLLKEFRDDYGVEIKDGGVEIKDVNPAEIAGIPSLRELTLKKKIAEAEKERIKVEADAEAERLEKVAGGEVQRLAMVWGKIQEFGELGKFIRMLEALEKSGAKWIVPLPEGAEALRGVLGKKPVESISSEEITSLREGLQNLEELIKKLTS